MRKISLIIFLVMHVSFCNCQTKKVTENWIVSKFEKYKMTSSNNDNFHPYNAVPLKLSFNECCIEFKEEFTQLGVFDVKPEIRIYKVMIGDIKSYTWNKNVLVIKSRKYNILIKSYLNNENLSKATSQFGDVLLLTFNIWGEAELDERLTKAFEHLKSFCTPSVDEKEAF